MAKLTKSLGKICEVWVTSVNAVFLTFTVPEEIQNLQDWSDSSDDEAEVVAVAL